MAQTNIYIKCVEASEKVAGKYNSVGYVLCKE